MNPKTASTPSRSGDSTPVESALIRINKAIAQAGICSRRHADDLIAAGKVRVNNAPVTSAGMKVDPHKDSIEVNGKPLPRTAHTADLYLMLNKPVRTVTTASDPEGRTTVLDLLPRATVNRRVFPVGRLDYLSEGLLLLTTDGNLTQKMTHPGFNHPKTYEVRVAGDVTRDKLATMTRGMTLAEGEKLRPVQVTIMRSDERTALLRMVLRQGVNRQIRRMCRDLDLKILKLKRVQQGPLTLGRLPLGKCRELTTEEVLQLKKSVQ